MLPEAEQSRHATLLLPSRAVGVVRRMLALACGTGQIGGRAGNGIMALLGACVAVRIGGAAVLLAVAIFLAPLAVKWLGFNRPHLKGEVGGADGGWRMWGVKRKDEDHGRSIDRADTHVVKPLRQLVHVEGLNGCVVNRPLGGVEVGRCPRPHLRPRDEGEREQLTLTRAAPDHQFAPSGATCRWDCARPLRRGGVPDGPGRKRGHGLTVQTADAD